MCYGQNNDNFKRLQEMSFDQIYREKQKPKSKSDEKPQLEQEQIELDINDSIFKLFDVDIDLTLGEISFDTSWGDPVKNPKIRRNRASNLFGPVRHYALSSQVKSGYLQVRFPCRRVFVTGGASGIGKAIVEAFRNAGCRVAFCDMNVKAGQTTAETSGSQFYPADVHIESPAIPDKNYQKKQKAIHFR